MIKDEFYKNENIPVSVYENCTFEGCTIIDYKPENFIRCIFKGVNKNKLIAD